MPGNWNFKKDAIKQVRDYDSHLFEKFEKLIDSNVKSVLSLQTHGVNNVYSDYLDEKFHIETL